MDNTVPPGDTPTNFTIDGMLTGDFGVFKKLAKLPLSPGTDGAFTRGEKAFYDLRPRLTATRGWTCRCFLTDRGACLLRDPSFRALTLILHQGPCGGPCPRWYVWAR